MKQVLQAAKGGKTRVADVPPPTMRSGSVLVRTEWSLISAGTERMVIELAGKSLLGKARARPDLVKKTLGKLRREGLVATYRAVTGKLASDVPLGYSAAGTVLEVAPGVTGIKPGDRVACAGAGYANHAEVLCVPRNLCARVPEGVDTRVACVATLGAIAMHGVRTTALQFGEIAVVIGLGLLGQLSVQFLKAAGMRVVGVDLNPWRAEIARKAGADVVVSGGDDPLPAVLGLSEGHGADGVLVCAASKTSAPLSLAGELCRKGGVVTVVGAVGMELDRRLFYAKELDVRMSTSYGPGRYDPVYEERGLDYPYAYVRWTEGRNLGAVLDLVSQGRIDLAGLLTHEFEIDRAEDAYELVRGESGEPFMGIVLSYSGDLERAAAAPPAARAPGRDGQVRVAAIGAGNFANAVLFPALKSHGAVALQTVTSAGGVTAEAVRRHFGFHDVSAGAEEILGRDDVDAVAILTRHDSHAELVAASLAAGKPCFVEKPLAITQAGLDTVIEAMAAHPGMVCVGFNRRFAPAILALREKLVGRTSPLHARYRVNAGRLPQGHWTLDPDEGGGRILGEACHMLDLLAYVAKSRIQRVQAESVGPDGAALLLRFADGSTAVLDYNTAGDGSLPKELLEVHWEGVSLEMDDFRSVVQRSRGKETSLWSGSQDKGHRAELAAFVDAVREGRESPIPFECAVAATRASLGAVESMASGEAVDLVA